MAIALAVLHVLGAVALHAVLCRQPPAVSAVLKFLVAGGLVGLWLVVLLVALFGLSVPTLAGVLVYALASELYIFLFTLVHSSVSAVWLRRLRRGEIEAAALARQYDPAWMVESRLDKLVRSGLLVRTGGAYRLTDQAHRLIATFGRLRAFFGHDRRAAGGDRGAGQGGAEARGARR